MDAHKKLVENVAIRLMHECTCIFLSVHMFLKSCTCSSFHIQFPFEWPHVLQPRMPSHILKKMCTFPYMLITKKSHMLKFIYKRHIQYRLVRGYIPRVFGYLEDALVHIFLDCFKIGFVTSPCLRSVKRTRLQASNTRAKSPMNMQGYKIC